MKKAILSTLSALMLAGGLAVPAFAFADGSVHFDGSQANFMSTLNPQPLPPGRHPLMVSGNLDGTGPTVDTAHKSPGRNK